jgi:ABC-type polysaccharide/polyol phosphate export permease
MTLVIEGNILRVHPFQFFPVLFVFGIAFGIASIGTIFKDLGTTSY